MEIYFKKTAHLVENSLNRIENWTWSSMLYYLGEIKKAFELEDRVWLGWFVSLSSGTIGLIILITVCLIFLIPSITFNQFGAIEKWAVVVYLAVPMTFGLLFRKIHWSIGFIVFLIMCLFMSNSGLLRNMDVTFNFGPIFETLKITSLIIIVGMIALFTLIVGPILMLEFIVLTPTALFFYLLNRPFRFFNVLTNGQAVGGVGICLASIGLFGEIYQFFTLFS